MIVLGADTHKRSHTIAAVAAATGELLGEQTVAVGRRGFGALLRWARGLDGERVWALEDCRHVSGSLERFLIGRGERVLRIPTHLSAGARNERPPARQVGSRSTRSTSPAPRCRRAWTRSRPRTWTGPSSTCGCSSTTANASSAIASSSTARCSGTCTTSGPSSSCPAAPCSRKWSTRIARRLARAEQTMRVRIARDELRRLRELTLAISRSSARSPNSSPQLAPQLLDRARVRAADRRQARRRDRRRAALRDRGQARSRRRRRADPRQLRQHAAANGSTRAATARSTPRCTA